MFGWLDEMGDTQCLQLLCSAWDECRVIVGLMCRSLLPYQGGLGIHYLTQWSLSVSGDDGGGGGGGFTLAGPVARTILLEPTGGDFREREGVDVQG